MVEAIAELTPEAWLDAGVNALGVFFAIVAAVWLTPRLNRREAQRNNQERVLRMLVNSRVNVANPDWQTAISLIPIEFPKSKSVQAARKTYLEHVSIPVDGTNPEVFTLHVKRTAQLQSDLISSIAAALKISGLTTETLMQDGYLSKGYVDREILVSSALGSLPRIETALQSIAHSIAKDLGRDDDGATGREVPPPGP